MRKIVFIMLLFFGSYQVNYAQEATKSNIEVGITKSELFKDKKRHTFLAFSVSDESGGVILIRSVLSGFPIKKVKRYYMEHYDSNLKLLSNYEYEVDDNRIISAFVNNNRLHLIERNLNKKEDVLEMNVKTTDIGAFSFSEKNLLKISTDELKKFGYFNYGIGMRQLDDNYFGDIEISENNKYLGFSLDLKNKDKENHEYYLFTTDFELVFKRRFERNIKDRKFTYQNITINEDDASILMLGKAFVNSKKKKKDGGKYNYELYKISDTGIKTLTFDVGKHYIGSMSIIYDGELKCLGFYSDKNDSRYKGVAFFKINDDLKLEKSKYSPFTEQFIKDKYGKSKDKELHNVSVKDILVLDSGDLIFNAEEFYITTSSTVNAQGNWVTTYIYHYNDIMSIKLSKEGELLWARNINKRQSAGIPSPYLSFTSTSVNGKSYYFINCSDKIKKIRKDRLEFRGTSGKKSNLYVITINEKGEYNYKKVLDDKDNEVPFAVGNGIISDNGKEILFSGRRKSKKQILKLSI